jgi:hypothetical protein
MSHHILGKEQAHDHAHTNLAKEPALYAMMEWFVKNKKSILIGAIAVTAAISFSVWRSQARDAQKSKDIMQANMLASDLSRGDADTSNEEIVRQLKAIDDQYPSLQNRYDGIIAQELILENKGSEIDPYAKRAVENLQEIGLVNFAAFSEGTRLIALGQHEKAAEQLATLELKLATQTAEDIAVQIQKNEFALHAFTLLELTSLYDKLGKNSEMIKTRDTLSALLGVQPDASLEAAHAEAAASVRAILEEPQGSVLDSFNKNK